MELCYYCGAPEVRREGVHVWYACGAYEYVSRGTRTSDECEARSKSLSGKVSVVSEAQSETQKVFAGPYVAVEAYRKLESRYLAILSSWNELIGLLENSGMKRSPGGSDIDDAVAFLNRLSKRQSAEIPHTNTSEKSS